MTGRIHSFQSLGTVDGPGVRCVVFMQGCPLRCVCCHNPDTWDPRGGEETDTDTLVRKIVRFHSYFGERGGVTVSGGEPLMQAAFTADLFRQLHGLGIHTALDTSGCVSPAAAADVLEHTDLVLLDHKYPTGEGYRRNTGGSLRVTEDFLAELQRRGIPVWLRRVIIPGLSDTPEGVRQLNAVARRFPVVEKIELLPFRNICIEKYRAMGIPFPLENTPLPEEQTMNDLNALLDDRYR